MDDEERFDWLSVSPESADGVALTGTFCSLLML
jgi:hypothetical protein